MLVRRQRDVEMVDGLAPGDLGSLVERAEQRQASVAEMIANRAVVHKADDLIAELTVLDDLVGDQTSELAEAGDQNPAESDPGAPAPLEHVAHQLARSERR